MGVKVGVAVGARVFVGGGSRDGGGINVLTRVGQGGVGEGVSRGKTAHPRPTRNATAANKILAIRMPMTDSTGPRL